MWAILVVGSIRLSAWVVYAISVIPIHVCTIPQKHGINLIIEQGQITEVMGEIRFKWVFGYKTKLVKGNLINIDD